MTQHRTPGQNPRPRRSEKLKVRMFYLLSEWISVTFDIRGLHRSRLKAYSCEDYRLQGTARWCVFWQKLTSVWKIVSYLSSGFTSYLKLKTVGYSETQRSARLHGVISQKTAIFTVSEMRTSHLTNIVGVYWQKPSRCVLTYLYNVLHTVSTQQYISSVIQYIQSGHITATCFGLNCYLQANEEYFLRYNWVLLYCTLKMFLNLLAPE